MTLPKFKTKKRGRKGEGRATRFRPVQLPVETIEELKLYKEAYSHLTSTRTDRYGCVIPEKVSFEQMLTHWMERVRVFDPEVADYVDEYHRIWKERGITPEMPMDIDPFEYPVWDFDYYFNVDLVEMKAEFDGRTFICRDKEDKDADGLDLEAMYNHNWPLMNNAGYEFTLEQAHRVCMMLAAHMKHS